MSIKKYENINKPLPEKTQLKNYDIICPIDTGGYSIVYYAYDRKMDNFVAIKEFMPSHLELRKQGTEVIITDNEKLALYNTLFSLFLEEINMINRINHPNVVKCVDYFFANKTAYLVTPYEVGEPLSQFMANTKYQKQMMDEKDVLHITTGILKAVQEMHRNNILHLDLKPNNIWLRPNKDVVILDFGTAILDGSRRNLMVYTAGFAAIELYSNTVLPKDSKHTQKERELFAQVQSKINASLNNEIGKWTDYYAIGATIYNMLTFQMPQPSYQLYQNAQQLDTSQLYGTTHLKLIDAINKLCQHDINARKLLNLQDISNTLKNIIPYPNKEMDYADIIAKRPSYVMRHHDRRS